MYYIPRGGNRGGADQFTWSSVKTDKDREYYLGHSLKAPVGRWQDGRDLQWFNKNRKEGDSMADERRAIKQAEEEAMMAALGQKVVKRSPNVASLTQQNLDPAASGKGWEDKLKKRSKRSHVKSMKKHKKEKAKKKSGKRRNRHSSSDSSTESSDSSSSDESEEKMTKNRRKRRPRNSDEDETWTNEMSRMSKNHRVMETPSERHKHHDDSVNHRGSHRHSDRPPEKHSERPPEKRRDRDTERQRESDSPSKRRRPSDSAHHAKRDTDLTYKRREKGKHPPRR